MEKSRSCARGFLVPRPNPLGALRWCILAYAANRDSYHSKRAIQNLGRVFLGRLSFSNRHHNNGKIQKGKEHSRLGITTGP